jgi:Polysaccharide lyase
LTGASCLNLRGASCRNSETGCRYTLARRDVGHTLRAVVTITTAGGSTSQASLPTQAVSRAESPAWLGRFSGSGGCLAPSLHWSTSFVASHVHCATDPLGGRHTVLEYDITNSDFPYGGDDDPRGDVKGPKMFFPGNDYYVSIPILIPNGYPLIPAGGWNMFAEVYGAPYHGSPTNALGIRNDLGDDKNHLVLGGNINGRDRQVWYGPPVDGHWHTIILHINFAIDATGFFELWYDGVQQNLKGEKPGTKRLYAPTMILNRTWDGTDGNFLDINSYRLPTVYSGTLTLYHGSPAVGRTLASVESTVCCGGAGP